MASGSHTYRGICADFPIAPAASISPIQVAADPVNSSAARSNTPE